jgi:hypothetical protein
LSITGLTLGYHDIEIRETNTKNASSTGNEFHFEGLLIPKSATVVNYGISGISTSFFYSYTGFFEADDTITLIMLGTNDRGVVNIEGYKYRLDFLRYIAARKGSKPILMSANPVSYANDTTSGFNFKMEDVDKATSDVARKNNMNYINEICTNICAFKWRKL